MEACVCVYIDGDGPDMNDSDYDDFDPRYGDGEALYFDEVVEATEEHKCIECNCEIKPGQKYERVDARYEGDWTRFHTCLPCMNVRNDLFNCGWRHMGGLV